MPEANAIPFHWDSLLQVGGTLRRLVSLRLLSSFGIVYQNLIKTEKVVSGWLSVQHSYSVFRRNQGEYSIWLGEAAS